VIAAGLPLDQHTVIFTRRTEASFGVVQYLGLLPQDGELILSKPPYSRRIEIIGDSIAAGFGVLGTDASCRFGADTEDEGLAFGGLLAKQFGAGHATIASSGKGVLRDYANRTTEQMPELFERALPDDPSSKWTFANAPDVVIVGLGTNDFASGDPGISYEDAYGRFLRRIRGHYPEALIVCMSSPMLKDGLFSRPHTMSALRIHSVVRHANEEGDARVIYVGIDEQKESDGYGCERHPSRRTHEILSARLSATIRAEMNW
jgi:lysophospholipase L1-like esterase